MHSIGILHPGAMGTSVAASAIQNGHQVYWASAGRSVATRERAAQHHLQDAETLAQLCAQCDVILSICPPHAAQEVARAVIANHFRGLYCDANAIAPRRAQDIGELLQAAGIDFVDGGIIGGPAWQPGETWLYLSGSRAADIAACFVQGSLETRVIGSEIGQASALKMCYSAYTKGTTALLCAVLAASEHLGVRQTLYAQWTRDDPAFVQETEQRVRNATKKAWRFEGEMLEIAATFASAGITPGFHHAAAEIYHSLSPLKGQAALPPLETVLAQLLAPSQKEPPIAAPSPARKSAH